MIRREAHPVLTGAQQLLKRMAIFFTGIVCAGLVLTLSVDAYRDKFFMTLKTLREDATQYNYSSEEKDAVLRKVIHKVIHRLWIMLITVTGYRVESAKIELVFVRVRRTVWISCG